jgi:hypothetical protein
MCILAAFTGRHYLVWPLGPSSASTANGSSPIPRSGETLADFIAEAKPTLPPEGVECICSHRKIKGTYRRCELIYQKSALARC